MPRPWWILLLLVGVPLLVFGQSIAFELVKWDDPYNITQNPYFNPLTLGNMARLWMVSYFGFYVPLTYTLWGTLAAINLLLGLNEFNPHLFHLANLLLHLGCTYLVYRLLRVFIADSLAACCGALLFAVHPLQVEPVCWATEARGLLSALFSLAAVFVFVQGRQLQAEDPTLEAPRPAKFTQATLLYILGLLAKPSAVSVPLVVWVIDYFYFKKTFREATKAVVDWLVIAGVWVVITKIAQPGDLMKETWPLWTRPLVAFDALAFYLKQLVFPYEFAIDYGRSPTHILRSGEIYWTWIPIVLIAFFLLIKPAWRLPRAAAAISVVVLLPVLGLMPFHFQAISTVADRYAYLTLLGPAIFLAWLLARAPRSLLWGAAVVLLLLSARSWDQAGVWRNSRSLFQHALEVNPRSYAAQSNLAVVYQEQGDVEKAEQHFRNAIEIAPHSPEALLGLASLLMNRGDTDDAFSYFQKAYDVAPDADRANAGLAIIYLERGDTASAIGHFRQAFTLEGGRAAPTLIGTQWAAVAERYARVLATCPQEEFRDGQRAVELAQKTVKLTSARSIKCLDTLAAAYAELGQYDNALQTLEQAIQLASQANQLDQVNELIERKNLYECREPLRENPTTTK